MSTAEYFRRALQEYMEQQSVTQKVLSIETDIPRSRISEIVNGRLVPGLKTQERIAQSAGYDLCDFLARGRDLLGRSSLKEDRLLKTLEPCENVVCLRDGPMSRVPPMDLENLVKIFESGNPVIISAIQSNLCAFAQNADLYKANQEKDARMATLEERLDRIEKKGDPAPVIKKAANGGGN